MLFNLMQLILKPWAASVLFWIHFFMPPPPFHFIFFRFGHYETILYDMGNLILCRMHHSDFLKLIFPPRFSKLMSFDEEWFSKKSSYFMFQII